MFTLMQTNREDVGKRFCEVCIPMPLSPQWAKEVSCSFRKYFESLAKSKETFAKEVQEDSFDYIASVSAFSDNMSD